MKNEISKEKRLAALKLNEEAFQEMERANAASYEAGKKSSAANAAWRVTVKEVQRMEEPELISDYDALKAEMLEMINKVRDFKRRAEKSKYCNSSFDLPNIFG